MFQFVPKKWTEAVDDILDTTPAAYFREQNTQSTHFHVCYVSGGKAILLQGLEKLYCVFSRSEHLFQRVLLMMWRQQRIKLTDFKEVGAFAIKM